MNATTELVRLARWVHLRDKHNQYFFRCESDICRRAVLLGKVKADSPLPNPDYGCPEAETEFRKMVDASRPSKG